MAQLFGLQGKTKKQSYSSSQMTVAQTHYNETAT